MTDRTPAVLVTANVKGWLPMIQTRVRRALLFVLELEVTDLELEPDLIGWQELWWRRYRRALRKNLPAFGHNAPYSRPGSGGCCTSYRRTRFSFVDAGQLRLSGVLVGVSGWRGLTYTRLVDKLNGRSITHGSAHLIVGAFNPRASRRARRRELWDRAVEQLRDWIEDEVRAGQLVILSVDGNAPRRELIRALGTHIAGEPVRIQSHGIDHLIIVGRALVVDEATAHPGTPSDHDPVSVVASW